MSTKEDTNIIDEKKGEETGTSIDFKGFIKNYLSSIIFTIIFAIFIIGGLGLYTTKVAQANILPDNIELAPFTVFDRIVEPKPVDINIMRPSFFSENKETFCQKATFNSKEYLDSFSNSFLCSLKSSAVPNNGFLANAYLFFSTAYENIIAKNFLAINTIFLSLSYLPESLIMIIYGFFGIFIWIILYFYTLCVSIFYHIVSIPQLFRYELEKKSEKWQPSEDIGFLNPKLLIFCFIWWWVGLISAFLSPIFLTVYGLIAPLYARYDVNQTNKTFNVFNFITNTFLYKKFFFFVLATLSLVSNGIKYLGNNSIIGILVAVVFAYFMGLYRNEMPEQGIDGFTSKINQNIKQSQVMEVDLNNPKMVEICKPKKSDNKTNLITKGMFRKVTKPKINGGDSELPNQPLPNQPLPNQPLPNQPLPNQPLPNQPLPNQPLPNQPLPNQPLPNQPLPNQPLPNQPLPNQPLPNSQLGGRKMKKYNIRWT